MRLWVLLLVLLAAAAGAQPEREPARPVRFHLSTEPSPVDVYLLPARTGPTLFLGRSDAALSLRAQGPVALLLQTPGYRSVVVHVADLPDGARLGPYTLSPAPGDALIRLVRENRWLLMGWLVVALLHLYTWVSVRRYARMPPPGPPASIGEVLYANQPIQPQDLPLRRRADASFVLGCGGLGGLLLGGLIWAGAQLVGTPLSADWIWKAAAWACLALGLMEALIWDPLDLAQYVGDKGVARFRFTSRVLPELVLFEEIARVETETSPHERDMGHHEVTYHWLDANGSARLTLHDIQGAVGFAEVAFNAWRQASEPQAAPSP